MNLIWFLLGLGLGGSAMGVFMNHRFLKALIVIEGEVRKLVAHHDHIVRGLIAANDHGRRKNDPLS